MTPTSSYWMNHRNLSSKVTSGLLKEWDLKCDPPMPEEDLEELVNSAEKGYMYTCGHRMLQGFCPRKENCLS